MFDNFGSKLKETYDAIHKGVDVIELWKDMKNDPALYGSSAFSATAVGLFYGARKGNLWYAAAGAIGGAATGIIGQYIVKNNFKKKPEPAKTSTKLHHSHKRPMKFAPREK